MLSNTTATYIVDFCAIVRNKEENILYVQYSFLAKEKH